MMNQFCHSCGMPLSPEVKGPAETFCKYCTDDQGKLNARESVQQGIAEFLKSWSPNLDDSTAMQRAECYMKAMPAWAD